MGLTTMNRRSSDKKEIVSAYFGLDKIPMRMAGKDGLTSDLRRRLEAAGSATRLARLFRWGPGGAGASAAVGAAGLPSTPVLFDESSDSLACDLPPDMVAISARAERGHDISVSPRCGSDTQLQAERRPSPKLISSYSVRCLH
jgi:hypothetical protein